MGRIDGDIIHCSPVIRALKDDGFEITFEYNYKGLQLLRYHPLIDHHRFFEPCSPEYRDKPVEYLYERWEKLGKDYDKVVNLYRTLEYGMIVMEDMEEWKWSKEERHKRFNKNFYDHQLAVAGYPHITGRVGEIFYPEHEHQFIKNYLKPYREKGFFIILYNLSGTGLHKVYPFPQRLFSQFLSRHKDVVVLTTGDKTCQILEWEHPRVHKKAGKIPFRQALLLAKYVDCVIGCETGLLVGAGMWGTPKIMLLTAASKENLVKYDKNDYSLESPAECAPCHKGPYKYIDCPRDKRTGLPLCVFHNEEKILERMEEIYKRWCKERKKNYTAIDADVIVQIRRKKQCPLCTKKREVKVIVNDCEYAYCEKCGIAFTDWENIKPAVYDAFYYAKYQTETSRKAYEYTYSKIMRYILANLKGARGNFLDIGAINSVILDKAKEDGFTTYGLDINPQSKNEKHNFYIGDFEKIDIKERFLVIWASHILEHLKDPLKALQKIKDLLVDGGIAFISMPNLEFVDWNSPEQFKHWIPSEHYIMWDREKFVKRAKDMGFEVLYSANNDDRNFICWGDMHNIFRKNG